jgi:hypoxanthine phosphoribosyltransferase
MMKEQILEELQSIQELKQEIEARIIAGLTPVYDVTDVDKETPLDESVIEQRSIALANKLISERPRAFPLLLSVMHGALPFTALVQKELTKQNYSFQYETIQVSSYQGTTSGKLTISSRPKIPVAGRHVIVVDDICDTGKTYYELRKLLLAQHAASVQLMVLVDKAQPRVFETDVSPEYVGVTISPTAFIAGYGMDYEELLRNVPLIGAVNRDTLPTEAEKATLARERILNIQLQNYATNDNAISEQSSNRYSKWTKADNTGQTPIIEERESNVLNAAI